MEKRDLFSFASRVLAPTSEALKLRVILLAFISQEKKYNKYVQDRHKLDQCLNQATKLFKNGFCFTVSLSSTLA